MPDTHKDKLMGEAITRATELLKMLGEFYPFGIVEYPNGEIAFYSAQDDTEQEIIDLLVGGFSILAKRGKSPEQQSWYQLLLKLMRCLLTVFLFK